MIPQHVYLDHQAATPVLPQVLDAMLPFFIERFGNASSLHGPGIAARDGLKKAREQFATFCGTRAPEEITFTSNGAEAVNLAIKGAALANQRRGKHIVLSAIEHPAVNSSVAWLESLGFSATRVPVDPHGKINPAAIHQALREDTILVCAHHANHDLGTIQPLAAIGEICAEHGVMFFVDAVASAGWTELNAPAWNASLLAISPHRFYGPKGVGVLYRNRRVSIQPLIHGGMQEEGRRAGTENIPAIVGAGVAAEIAAAELPHTEAHTSTLQQKLWSGIQQIFEVRLNGPSPGPERLSSHLSLSFTGLEGEGLALALDLKGIHVAAGSACVLKENRISPVLSAIGLDETWAGGTVILTLGRENTEAELDYVLQVLPRVVSHLREMGP